MASRTPASARQRQFIALGLAGVIGLGGAGVWLSQRRGAVPQPGAPEYEEIWTTWTNGLLALQTGDEKRAEAQLTRLTQLLPGDAAGHADLGLFFLRRGAPSDLETAATQLNRAAELAPENARIQTLLALLASRQGDAAASIKYLQRALELSPSSLKARYALAQALEQQGEASLPEVQKQLQQLSDARPGNRLAAIELARVAARRGDKDTLRLAMERIAQGAASLPNDVQQQLREAQKAVASNAPDAATQIVFLKNVLGPVPAFAQDRRELESPPEQVGEPLENLLTIAAPPPAAAAPDEAISFQAQPVALNANGMTAVRAIYQDGADAPAKGKPPTPAVATLGASGLSVVSGSAASNNAALAGTRNTPDSLAVADWNNDYLPDLATASSSGLRIFVARDGGRFEDATAKSGLPPTILKAAYTGVWAYDFEADGDLDLVMASASGAPFVLRNNSDGTFAVARPFAGISGARGCAIGDFDSDADCDIAFLDASGTLRAFSNERAGAFRLLALDVPPSAALCIADLDRDGLLDIQLWGRDGALRRVRVQAAGKPGIDELAKYLQPQGDTARLFAGDFDLNGAQDILASSGGQGGAQSQIFLADAGGALKPLTQKIALLTQDVADLNGDGRLDLLGVDAQGRAASLVGAGTKKYGFQVIRPRAKESVNGDGRLNSFAVGGSVEARAGTLFQKQVINGPLVHFGLGSARAVNALRILWPNGAAQAEFDLAPGQSVLAEQRLTGSCPYLWAWNGREVAFVKDCNWDSPLGLRINAQDTAGVVATEDWNKVRGDQLQPRDGILDLRVTADLWEAHFFDSISLLAIDRPADEQMWVDERFAIPIPPLRAQASGQLHPVRSARDDRGRDVTATVQKLDDKYLDAGRGRYQGISRPHWVELDLSDAPQSAPLLLVAEGWTHPTDSSINAALGQGKHAPPQSLSLQVLGAGGKWRTARSNLGFPSGKNKAITLDLRGLFQASEPRKLRLATNLEIYWDRLAWAQQKPSSRLRIQRLAPASATLRFRGFSQIEARDVTSPELPLSYAPGSVGQKWSDLIGLYTRWGDVRELLQKSDDRSVIMNAGDEMALRFKAPAPPSAGWARDYVFISDGWTKDGNLNTGLSKTLQPLPSHARPLYPSRATRLQDDPVYKAHKSDWAKFHTRFVAPGLFNSVLLPPQNSDVVATARAGEGNSAQSQAVTAGSADGEGARVPVRPQSR